jgi:hypothetical protein
VIDEHVSIDVSGPLGNREMLRRSEPIRSTCGPLDRWETVARVAANAIYGAAVGVSVPVKTPSCHKLSLMGNSIDASLATC